MAVRIGDVIALDTSKGVALAQVVHRDRLYGTLIRVLQPLFETIPADVVAAVRAPDRFYTFFPVNAAISKGIVQKIGQAPVPPEAQAFPVLRVKGDIQKNGSVSTWWLWDGTKEWPVGLLDAETRRLSIAEVVNDTLLRQRIESDWTPSADG